MKLNLVSNGWTRNKPWGTEHAFAKGLIRLAHEVVYVEPGRGDELDMSADATVVFKHVEHTAVMNQLRVFFGPKIVYQPDDLRFQHIREEMNFMRELCDGAVIFEPDGVQTALEMGYKKATRIFLPVDDTLYRKEDVAKTIDVCFVANFSNEPCHLNRRLVAQNVREMKDLKTVVCSSFDAHQVNRLYNLSKIVLHHATDVGQPFGHGYGFQSRHFEGGFAGSCVLSNFIDNELDMMSRDQRSGLMTYDSESDLEFRIRWLLGQIDDEQWWDVAAQDWHDAVQWSHRPEHRAQELVDFIGKF